MNTLGHDLFVRIAFLDIKIYGMFTDFNKYQQYVFICAEMRLVSGHVQLFSYALHKMTDEKQFLE